MAVLVTFATIAGALTSLIALWLQVRGRRVIRKAPPLQQPVRSGRDGSDREMLRIYTSGHTWPDGGHRDGAHVYQVAYAHSFPSPSQPGGQPRVKLELPTVILGMMPLSDALRYTVEFSGHLLELEREGAFGEAKRHRQQLALGGITLAVGIQLRRILGISRTAPSTRK